ncbi:unnamed protein product [Parnassius apollo]|uniref:(apollo) hypothetical protein n=1 Tax=Parnassius apollo TaxID=110799 RepID=A0A8S3X2G6_PARAO|nr:unnamed protein product [Parnassius apollo]
MSSLHYVYLFIGLIAASLSSVRALPEEEIEAIESAMYHFVIDCGKEFGVDEEEFKKAKESGNTDSLDPCLLACFAKKIGFINDEGMFDTEKATERTKQFIVNEKAQKKVMEVVEKCSSVNEQSVGDDKGCERAVLLAECFKPLKDQLAAL